MKNLKQQQEELEALREIKKFKASVFFNKEQIGDAIIKKIETSSYTKGKLKLALMPVIELEGDFYYQEGVKDTIREEKAKTKQQDKLLFEEFVRKLKETIPNFIPEIDKLNACCIGEYESYTFKLRKEIDKLSQEVLG